MEVWYFEVADMFRRFLVVGKYCKTKIHFATAKAFALSCFAGLPKILRAVASSNESIQFYIGLLVMTVAPVIYGELDPYQDKSDHGLMILTQLAHSIVMFCGIVYETVPGNLANVIVSALSLVTLVPMFVILILYILDPRSDTASIYVVLAYSRLTIAAGRL